MKQLQLRNPFGKPTKVKLGGDGIIQNINPADPNKYRFWIGTKEQFNALTKYEEDVIYIAADKLSTAPKYDTSLQLSHATVKVGNKDLPEKVEEGTALEIVVSPSENYTIDTVSVVHNDQAVEGVKDNATGAYTFTIESVAGDIAISASSSIHIETITVTAGERSANTIPLTAAVSPNNAENVTLAWSVNDDTKFHITGDGVNAELVIDSSVASATDCVVQCTDTNTNSDVAVGELTLEGLYYIEPSAQATEITNITAERTAANTLTLTPEANGDTTGIEYSIVGNAPTCKKVIYTTTTEEVDGQPVTTTTHETVDVAAVEIVNNTVIYKKDCSVTIKATLGNIESGNITLQISHNTADDIYFEDVKVVKALNNKYLNGYSGTNIGSTTGGVFTYVDSGENYEGHVTYAQAATVTKLLLNNTTSIRRFRECKYFNNSAINAISTGSSAGKLRFDGCTNLEYVEFPNSLTSVDLTALANIKVTELIFPDGVSVSGALIDNFPSLEMIYINGTVSGDTGNYFLGNASGVKPNNLTEIIFGPNVSSLPSRAFAKVNISNINLTLGKTTGCVTYSTNNNTFWGTTGKFAKLIVPEDLIDDYEASSWHTEDKYTTIEAMATR